MIHLHPYIRYAQALLLVENQLESIEDITMEHIKAEIKKGLEYFSVKPDESFEGKTRVKFRFVNEKSSAPNNIFLAPNSMTTDMQARNLYNSATDFIKSAKELDKSCEGGLTMASMPIAGEFCAFSEKGGVGRGKTSCTVYEQGLALISSLTPLKPCLQYRIMQKGKPNMFNVCIIPDIPLDALKEFIELFKRMRIQKLESDLLIGNVVEELSGKKKEFKPKRPHIFQGNFPNPPRSSAMGSIALLGAFGEMAKESEVSEMALRVLESLKDSTYYMIQYGNAQTFTYNHYVVELAQKSKLKTIVDSIYYSKLYNEDRRTTTSTEYQKFDLFTSRFLMLFNKPSFNGFLSFRAEYPKQVELLLNTYFTKMAKIDPNNPSSI
jgi:CRISPR-associated protein Cas8c/Csp2